MSLSDVFRNYRFVLKKVEVNIFGCLCGKLVDRSASCVDQNCPCPGERTQEKPRMPSPLDAPGAKKLEKDRIGPD